jgi:hypothetical protein
MTPTPPPAPAEEARAITPESQPVFPCWLWRPNCSEGPYWFRAIFKPNWARNGVFSHWHPDQPTPPTVTPAQGEHQGKPVPTDVPREEFLENEAHGAEQPHGDWMGTLADELTKFYVGNVVTPFEAVAIIAKHVPASFPRHGQRPAQGKREATGTHKQVRDAIENWLESNAPESVRGTETSLWLIMNLDRIAKVALDASASAQSARLAEAEQSLGAYRIDAAEICAAHKIVGLPCQQMRFIGERLSSAESRALAAEQKLKEVEGKLVLAKLEIDGLHAQLGQHVRWLKASEAEAKDLRAQLQQAQEERDALENVRLAALRQVGYHVNAIPQEHIDNKRLEHAFVLSAHRILATADPKVDQSLTTPANSP